MGCQSSVGSLAGARFAEYQSWKNTGRSKAEKHETRHVAGLSVGAQKVVKSTTGVEGWGEIFLFTQG